jgi:hypothetical protein
MIPPHEHAMGMMPPNPFGGLNPMNGDVETDEQARNVTPLDLLSSSNYTTKETRNSRLESCLGCDRLFKPTKTCKECGCFMAAKTWLKQASCPLQKW